ncbi:LVIVD repeat-containing protein [Actinosynnema sp. ALI-1.44]|uniref:LVIVD repeat-containing protein n=1 Tax=Actinosynnema sp. ALI-1.44 TaxID=1933779 RepID=UPI00192CFCD8|nr:hypothetical protein [Actinosynnema sp. ALI-1.44]
MNGVRWRLSRLAMALTLAVVPLTGVPMAADASGPGDSDVSRAVCGPGSAPETGLQGQVPVADRRSGRSQRGGYHCNLDLVGQFQGQGQATVGASYGHCQYLGSVVTSTVLAQHRGVNVIDFADPANPKLSASLASPAMLGGTWETLKVHQDRGLLAAVSVGAGNGGIFFSVYDVKTDCAHPRLLNSVAGTNLTLPMFIPGGHEGGWAPDGRTYWVTGVVGGTITAIDVVDPARPRVVYSGIVGLTHHGFGVSNDGNRIYVASIAPAGITVFDSSDIQRRALFPMLRQVSSLSWTDGLISQHVIPFTSGGKPYLVVEDEFASGGVRIIDIGDERAPRIVRRLKLEINRPENVSARAADTASNGIFGYEAHYCSLDRQTDPTALACGWTQSGVRVFDVRDLNRPREIAYFNPPGQAAKRGQLANSAHVTSTLGSPVSDFVNGNFGTPPYIGIVDLTADWCMSPPRFDGNKLWVSCDDNGALALRFGNGAYPLS